MKLLWLCHSKILEMNLIVSMSMWTMLAISEVYTFSVYSADSVADAVAWQIYALEIPPSARCRSVAGEIIS